MVQPPNINSLWAEILVDELCRAGLQRVVIAPGSRSTPLAIAFAAHSGISSYVHLDERGAAFFALGMALNSKQVVGVLCTSGTAAANFFPAVVEASLANVPLLVMTADRPDEARGSGSNQTIDQLKIFGDFVREFIQAPHPTAAPGAGLLRALRSLASRVVSRASGFPPGPVHLNLPFRKPLEPVQVEDDLMGKAWLAEQSQLSDAQPDGAPFVLFTRGELTPSAEQVAFVAEALNNSTRPLIYCGPRCPAGPFPKALYQLAVAAKAILFADALSGLRFHPDLDQASGLVFGGYETFLKSDAARKLPPPDLVIQFGGVPVSQSLSTYLEQAAPAFRIQVDGNGVWSDDVFTTSHHLWADPAHLCQSG